MKQAKNRPRRPRSALPLCFLLGAFALTTALLLPGCDLIFKNPPGGGDGDPDFPLVELPEGFKIEKVASGLNFPTSVTWDEDGRMYVAEAGGGAIPEQIAPMRLLRVNAGGDRTVIAELDGKVGLAVVGLVWHEGAFYITHRAMDGSGAVSRVTMDGQVTQILSGIEASKAEHQVNGIVAGPDGRLYVGSGQAGNSAVMGPDLQAPLMMRPEAQAVPCQDIVLRGHNFWGPDFRTEAEGDSVLTGAFVPFGEATQPGQTVPGTNKCGGAVLAFDPDNAEGTLEVYASGFRQPIGMTFDDQGQMYVGENGADIRGLRPINEDVDATLRVMPGTWYGWPDFSAGREPLTLDTFETPDSFQAPVFRGTDEPLGKILDFVIDHEASGLTPPDPSAVMGLHEVNSSPSLLDVAPASWGDHAGHLFVAEFGDFAPQTNPLRGEEPAGFQVVRIDPSHPGTIMPFVHNEHEGPASMHGPRGNGIERPFDVKFGPDGSMYIVDFGVIDVMPMEMPPYVQRPGTGVVWKITRAD